MKRGLFVTILALTLMVEPAISATIEKQPDTAEGLDLISIRGPINPNDDARFRDIVASSGEAVVLLDGEGGSTIAALEIGKAIRLKGFAAAVGPDTLCASACALIWLAGSPRYLAPTSNIGFHASYTLANGKASESGVANALVGAYLNQIGLSPSAIIFVTSAPPEGMEWLTSDNAAASGIDFALLKDSPKTARPRPKRPCLQ